MVRYYTVNTSQAVLICLLGIFLVLIALLRFGFYLWNLKSSDEQSQSRLLNILNGYLSAACMTGSPAVLALIMQMTIKKDLPGNELKEDEHVILNGRVTATHSIAVSLLFLLISFATILNHFKPGLYLDVSFNWRHKIAIPVMMICFILTEHTIHALCHQQEKSYKCEVFILRTMVIMTATVTSFLARLLWWLMTSGDGKISTKK